MGEVVPDSSVGKKSVGNAREPSSIPGWEKSAGEGKGYPLQYSGLDCIVHGVTEIQTGLGDIPFQKQIALLICQTKGAGVVSCLQNNVL